jgi:aspartate/methionine/tyrosine aminotransferase
LRGPGRRILCIPQGPGRAATELWGKGGSILLELASYLLEQALVATVPGEAFGVPGYLRLSYACSMGEIREGLARIKAALT